MKGLCGWFSTGGLADGRAALDRMLEAGAAAGREARADPYAGLGVYGDPAGPQLVDAHGSWLAVAGHPRLGLDAGRTADAAALAAAFRERGAGMLEGLFGDFAIAAWNATQRRGLLAVDRIGVQRLVHARTADGLAFGSTLDLLAGHPGLTRRLSPQALFDYLYFHVCPGPRTILEGMERLAPGHCIEFGPEGASPPRPYWTMRFTETSQPGLEERRQQFLALLQASVRDAAADGQVGAFLSGGTDSSTVSGMLGRATNGRARTFSIGFDVPGFDETEYARTAAGHFGTEHTEYYVTPADVVESAPRIATSYDQPFGNASAVPTYHCARLAQQHGVTRLLAGDGGDELFGGNERYAKQHLFVLYHRLPAVLREGVVEPLLLSGRWANTLMPTRKLRSYVEQARPPMPRRYESYNLLQHLGIAQVLAPDFLREVDVEHPRALMVDAHAPFAQDSLINQMLGIDLRFILADGDLPKVTHMCDLAGVDVTFPLLDDRLIEFSRHLPAELKLRGTQLRWFFKDALRGFLPPAIITKKKHGFGLPVGQWLLDHPPLLDLAVDSIRLLEPRGIVRREFVDELLNRRLREHPNYFGTMVWVLMMLGLWLHSRRL